MSPPRGWGILKAEHVSPPRGWGILKAEHVSPPRGVGDTESRARVSS